MNKQDIDFNSLKKETSEEFVDYVKTHLNLGDITSVKIKKINSCFLCLYVIEKNTICETFTFSNGNFQCNYTNMYDVEAFFKMSLEK